MKTPPAMLVGILAAAMACSPDPRIDASSPEACERSIALVSEAGQATPDSAAFASTIAEFLGGSLLSSFGQAFSDVLSAFDDDALTVTSPSPDSTMILSVMCSTLDGMTAREIVASRSSLTGTFSSLLEEQLARQHLAELRYASAKYDEARDSLSRFEVREAGLTQEQGYIGLESTIRLTVRNGTSHSISRAFFKARVASEGRSVPWIEEEFNHSIPGGLEPGEEVTWHLKPSGFQGDWNSVRVPARAEMMVEVQRLDGSDGEPLWGGPRFSSRDQSLLDSLLARFGPV
ncbi:hypothetical protein ACFL3S_02505 [Gemmatimonadota bacterium]